MSEMPYKSLERQLDEIVRGQREQEERINRGAERLVIVEQSCKSAHHRLDEQKGYTEAIIELGTTMKHVIEKLQTLIEQHEEYKRANDLWHKEQDERIEKINNKAGQLALSAWSFILAAVISALIGSIITVLVIGG